MMTVDLRRTHGRDMWNLGETTSEENGNREDETLEARSPEVNYHQ
jgi:hypothetical protein